MQSENFGSMWRYESLPITKVQTFHFCLKLGICPSCPKETTRLTSEGLINWFLKYTHLSIIYKIQQSLLFSHLTLIQSSLNTRLT